MHTAVDSTSRSFRGPPLALLWLAAAITAGLSIFRLCTVVPRYSMLDQASGVWTTLAIDLSHGIFYRPLISPDGYGGTRYFPLHFVLHAGLIRLGIDPIAAGVALAIACGIALVAGVYALLRNLKVPASLAAPAAMLALATEAGQMGITQIRGDLLPAALTVWGLASVARKIELGRDSDLWRVTGSMKVQAPIFAALLFTLAFAAKCTSLFGPAAALIALLGVRQRRAALGMAAVVLLGVGAVLIGLMAGTGGRFSSLFQACCTSDADLHTLLSAPAILVRLSLLADPMSLTILLLGGAALLTAEKSERGDIARPYLVCAAIAAILIFASPGVWLNHLIDLHIAAIVFVTSRIARGGLPARFTTALLAAAGMLCTVGAASALHDVDAIPERQRVNATLAALDNIRVDDARGATTRRSTFVASGPTLFEHPMMPVMARQTPYMLDPYMFAVAKANRPQLDRDLSFKLQQHYFPAVVLLHDPTNPACHDWYAITYFGQTFVDALLAHYRRLPLPDGCYVVYVPRTDDDTAAATVTSASNAARSAEGGTSAGVHYAGGISKPGTSAGGAAGVSDSAGASTGAGNAVSPVARPDSQAHAD